MWLAVSFALLVLLGLWLAPGTLPRPLQPTTAQAQANVIDVETIDDTSDSDCTLRDAITAANTNNAIGDCDPGVTGVADVIDLEDLEGTIVLTSPLPNLTSDIIIQGPGAEVLTIARGGGANFGIFAVESGTVEIEGLTIANGDVLIGGGIRVDAGSTLTVISSTITSNAASDGGGIFNAGNLILQDTTVVSNTSSTNLGGGGGIFNFNTGTLTMMGGAIERNTNNDGNGGGLANFGGSATLQGVHILTNTVSVDNNPERFGGGGIFNSSALTITDSTIQGNISNGTIGAGISSSSGSTLTLTKTEILDNIATDNIGGGIANYGTLRITGSTIERNRSAAAHGGGIANLAGGATATLMDVTLLDNTAQGRGGGIAVLDGTINLMDTSLILNTALESGGGIFLATTGNTLVNTTISGNVSDDGGALHIVNGGMANIRHSTIVSNTSSISAAIVLDGATLELANTIVAYHTTNFEPLNGGSIGSLGYNLEDGTSGLLGNTGDSSGRDPLLAPLADNGGATPTHALLADSPAINQGDPNFVSPPNTDQRGEGFARVFGGRIDIGAYELQQSTVPVPPDAPQCDQVSEIPRTECDTLALLYNETNGPNWRRNTNWLATDTPCSWYGVSCTNGRVTGLDLDRNGLTGPLPAELANLTLLEQLLLTKNELTESIPSTLGTLGRLQELQLDDNNLAGAIPPELGGLTSLQGLLLHENDLTGPIPSELGGLTRLQRLNLSNNRLTGPIPSELGGLTNLVYLFLHSNDLTGTIPPELAGLNRLQTLHLGNNGLTGTIPPGFGLPALGTQQTRLISLTELLLNGNALTGTIPPELGNLTSLELLALHRNQLTGSIPDELGNLVNLKELRLSGNQLTGTLPDSLVGMDGMLILDLKGNDICEPRSTSFQRWIDSVPQGLRTDVCGLPVDFFKTVSAPSAQPGETLSYTVTIRAAAANAAAILTDTLPVGLAYVPGSLSGGGSFDAASNQVRFSGTVSDSAPVTLTYQATVSPTLTPGSVLASTARLTGPDAYPGQTVSVVVTEPSVSNTLVLIYYSADNDLAQDGIEVLNSAEEAASNPNVTIVMMLDGPGTGDARLYRLQPDTTPGCPNYANLTCSGLYKEGETISVWPDNASDPFTLAEFIRSNLNAYPNADQVILTLIGHGSGISAEGLNAQNGGGRARPDPLSGLLRDDNPDGGSLSTTELGQALELGLSQYARGQIDGLYLDACLMGMAEVGYEVRGSARYLLSSENIKWAVSDYARNLDASVIDGTRTVPDILARWMGNEAASLASAGDQYPYTYALVDLAAIEQVRVELDGLVQAVSPTLRMSRTLVTAAVSATDFFDIDGDGFIRPFTSTQPDNYGDLAGFVRELGNQFAGNPAVTTAAGRVLTALDTAVITQTQRSGIPAIGPGGGAWTWRNELGGLSIYMPLPLDHWKRRYYQERHFQFVADGMWDEFMLAYHGGVPPTAPEDCTDACADPQTRPDVDQASSTAIYLPFIRQ